MRDAAAPAEFNYSIQAARSRADDVTRVLKHGETFAVFDHYGDLQPSGLGEQGIYHEGTRFLSRLEFRLFGARPLLLGSSVKEDNALLTVDLTNPAFYHPDGALAVQSGTLHIYRGALLWNGACCTHLRFANYGGEALALSFSLAFDADYADIFEVRGMKRKGRGRRLADVVEDDGITLAYEGLDGVVRRTRLSSFPAPSAVRERRFDYQFQLAPGECANFYLTVSCLLGEAAPRQLEFHEAWSKVNKSLESYRRQSCTLHSSSEPFNDWLSRSFTDLFMMTTDTYYGPYPYAGVPWFSTVFGRDGILTALETLWVNPALARGVLGFLAANQASQSLAEQDADPGKILHELRKGEMAGLREIPFGYYYGSVDSTPLFLMLAAAYYHWTGDFEFIESIWPNIEAALTWIERFGDANGDGFVDYQRHSETGLLQQGWKDSSDSVHHADGRLAVGPIALCEVQGYVYAALTGARQMAVDLGHHQRARELARRARELKQKFEAEFWCEELACYALALDGEGRACRVRSSNAGHLLLTGLADPERARRTAHTLLGEMMFTGWGVRTLATGEARYNPMSYHNGSVWPHDNALFAAGLARYGLREEALRMMDALFDLSQAVDLRRLPELICGFHRRPGEGPILYPVACAPQAWATGAVFMLLAACLNLEVNGHTGRVSLRRPALPHFLNELHIQNLRVGHGAVDLVFYRYGEDVGFNIERKEGEIEVMVVK